MAASLSLPLLTGTRALSRCPPYPVPPRKKVNFFRSSELSLLSPPQFAPTNTSPLTTPTLRAPEFLAAAPPTYKTFS
ncbi:hypothetical protein EDB89DRAFT_2014665 [Lactarius sanguifluus]|nr:hypothetical protein EDB89DRAFT_2014665 [Lactarius sanguifluus]